jgi:hypothetical protein
MSLLFTPDRIGNFRIDHFWSHVCPSIREMPPGDEWDP